MITTSIFLAMAGIIAPAIAQGGKPNIQPGMDWNRINQDLLNNLRPTQSTWDYWGAGWIPKGCKDIALSNGLNPNDFTIFNVHYDDCSEPWIFCRHKDTRASEIDMIDIFGRMPVRSRSYIRHFMTTPGLNDGRAAFIYHSGDVVFEDRPRIQIMAHELSHSLDWHAARQHGSPFSSTKIWQDNFNADKASVSDYSRTNWMEHFAEVGVIGYHDKVTPGGVGTLQPNWRDIFHQYATFQGYLGDNIIPGGRCRNRFANSEPVTKSNSAKARRELGPKPDVSFSGNITVIESEPELESMVVSHWDDHRH